MAATIKIKNSSTTGSVPSASNLVQGELAVNVTDLGLYTENASGTVVKLNAPSIDDKNTGATKHLTIDTSGNLGLGVTPSAWDTSVTGKVLQVSSAGLFNLAGGNNRTYFTSNAYYAGGGFKYTNSASASMVIQYDGSHQWFTAASGTAGNAITFTQAMTLDASGRLGVNRTSPGAQFDVLGAASVSAMRVVGNSGASVYIDLSGGGDNYYDATNNIFRNASGTERARIDSSGNLLVGGTTAYGLLTITGSSSGTLLSINGASGQDSVMRWASAGTNKAIGYWSVSNDRLIFANGASGGVYLANGGTSWTSASDERIKDIIEPIENATEKLSNWRTVIGKYKTDEEGTRRSFLIAQDVLATFPEAVDLGDEDEFGVRYQDTIPLLVKAIQELKAELDAAKARITALEA